MNEGLRFNQANYIRDSGEACLGVCARVTYKWLAGRLLARGFVYSANQVHDDHEKMVVYTREAMKLLKSSWFRYEPTRLDDGRKGNRLFASQYVVTDLIRLKDYIRIWGASDHITCRESVRRDLVDYVKTRTGFGRNIPGVLMVSFYLKTTAGAVNQVMRGGNLEGPDDRPIICGHVVGVDLAAHCFFDSNSGFYTMAGATPLEHAEDAEKFIEDNYTNEGLTRESNDRGVFLLDKVG